MSETPDTYKTGQLSKLDPAPLATAAQSLGPEIERVLVGGDLSKLNADQRVSYVQAICKSMGMNPLTRPFDYVTLQGKLTLYARKDATEQLRLLRGVSVTKMEREQIGDLLVCTCHVQTPDGRQDQATGVVNIQGLRGEALANAYMKVETKAKRRATLSIVGLGFMDESEFTQTEVTVEGGETTTTANGPKAGSRKLFPPKAPAEAEATTEDQPKRQPKPKPVQDAEIVPEKPAPAKEPEKPTQKPEVLEAEIVEAEEPEKPEENPIIAARRRYKQVWREFPVIMDDEREIALSELDKDQKNRLIIKAEAGTELRNAIDAMIIEALENYAKKRGSADLSEFAREQGWPDPYAAPSGKLIDFIAFFRNSK